MKTTEEKMRPEQETAEATPLTAEHDSHALGTGVGAVGAGVAGAAMGAAFGGPVGGVIGSLVGGILGAMGGHALAENIDPTAEDAHWREQHPHQPFAGEEEDDFESFAPAYRTGYLGYTVYGEDHDTFEDAEHALRANYEAARPDLPWEVARPAAFLAWTRVAEEQAYPDDLDENDPALDEARNNPTMDAGGHPASAASGQKGEARNNPTIDRRTGQPAASTHEDLEEYDPSREALTRP